MQLSFWHKRNYHYKNPHDERAKRIKSTYTYIPNPAPNAPNQPGMHRDAPRPSPLRANVIKNDAA